MTNKTFVFGHKNPDTDSIVSSIAFSYLRNKLGDTTEACRLGNTNKETDYALKTFNFDAPTLITSVNEGDNVILVDHNEATQSVDNIEKAHVRMVVDHHTMNFKCPETLYYHAEPVGCTATILYKLYKQNDVEVEPNMAGLLLSAIISDTLLFKSPTCTEEDRTIAQKLAEIANVDINTYGLNLLKAGTDLSDYTPEQVINIDSKLFEQNGKKFKIAQVNTADVNDIFKNQAYFEAAIDKEIKNDNLDLYVFAATDILNANSKIITMGTKSNVVEKAFGVSLDHNTATLENVVSRKKQILPNILNNLD